MSHINFKPWIGKNYAKSGFFGKKILVLGDSHYCKKELIEGGKCFPNCARNKMNEDCCNETIYCVSGHTYENTIRAYTIFERAFYGKELTPEEHISFWESIIFYNYIQFAQPGPRLPLVQPEFSLPESELAFKEILEEYLPDYVIAWGTTRLYDITPNWNGIESEIKLSENGDTRKVWTYQINEKKIPVLFIQHPSSGISWEYCHQFIKRFLNLPDSF